jgi:hypothetical protein
MLVAGMNASEKIFILPHIPDAADANVMICEPPKLAPISYLVKIKFKTEI